MEVMTGGLVACLVTAIAGVLLAGRLTPRRHLGYRDSWISFAIAPSMMLYVAIVELLPSICPSDRALLTPRQVAFVLTGIACVSATQWVAEMWI